jgi:hypothetical protein
MNHRFTGVFIPAEIWESKDVCPLEKMLYGEIDALDKIEGCYATNRYLADVFQVSERRIQQMLQHLKTLGLVNSEESDGKRILWVGVKDISSPMKDISPQGVKDISSSLHIIEKNKKKENVDNLKYLPLSETLKKAITHTAPDAIIKESQLKDWCNDFRLMVETDERTEQQIREKIDAVFTDEFWCRNIRSASKLRLRWNEGKLSHLNIVQIREEEEPHEIELKPYDL